MFKLRACIYAIFISIMMHNVHADSLHTRSDNFLHKEINLINKINELMQDKLIDFCATYYYELKEINKKYIHNLAEGEANIEKIWNRFKETGVVEDLIQFALNENDMLDEDAEELESIVQEGRKIIDEIVLTGMKQQCFVASTIYNRVHNTTETNV